MKVEDDHESMESGGYPAFSDHFLHPVTDLRKIPLLSRQGHLSHLGSVVETIESDRKPEI